MLYLLDTQAFLYLVADDPRLGSLARTTFTDPTADFKMSIASAWEISIKHSLGKLSLPQPPAAWLRSQLAENRISLLPIDLAHATRVAELPFHHKDPFDRLIIAQALCEKLPVVTGDEAFDAYGLTTVW